MQHRLASDNFWQHDTRYGQPIVKDGCGVFGVIRKPDAPRISNTIAVSGISCIKYRGSDLGAGYACFDTSDNDQYKVRAFVKDKSVAEGVVRQLGVLLGSPIAHELTTPNDTLGRRRFGVLSATFKNSSRDFELEKKVDEINFSLLSNRKVEGRIFSYGKHVSVWKEVGYPLDVAKLYGLDRECKSGDIWVSHTRQPTNSPGSSPIWSHPFASLDCAIVHNGDISSFGANMEFLNSLGYRSHVGTDSEVISKLFFHLIRVEGLSVSDAATILTNPFEEDMPHGAFDMLSRYRGAKLDGPFAVIAGFSDEDDSYLIALTDRSKFRPLLLGEDENCFYVASEEIQIRNISKNARVWAPDPGSFFIASLKNGLIESGSTRKGSNLGTKHARSREAPTAEIVKVDSTGLGFSQLNKRIAEAYVSGSSGIRIENLSGQRYLGIGLSTKREGIYGNFRIELVGYPGNCLANLNDGAVFEVFGNASDDIADTMHNGKVVIHGSARDVVGQTLQGGDIFVRGTVGNRAAIQMREYMDRRPFLIVGETADDYLGEYMAGGVVIVLNISGESRPVGNFVGTGMVGGSIYIRGKVEESQLGLAPKKSDILNYLKACALDGTISKEVYEAATSLSYPSEQRLEGLIPDDIFKRLRTIYFRNKYTKPVSMEFRRLAPQDQIVLSNKLEEFFDAFDIPQEQRRSVFSSEFTVIKTVEGEKENQIPPQEVPVEE